MVTVNNRKITGSGKFKDMPRILLAPFTVGVMALCLFLLGMIPGYLQSPAGVREYLTLEEAEADLGFSVPVPSYFPSYLSWPPATIKGQHEPQPTVLISFVSSTGHAEVLVINQMLSSGSESSITLPWVKSVTERLPVDINGNTGELVVGRRADGQTVNGVYWVEKDRKFAVVTTHSVRELLNIARSIHL